MKVVFILGSESDKDFARKIQNELDKWGVLYDLYVASAHKVPERVFDLVSKMNEEEEAIVYITIAGRSNGLSGVTAANSIHPVIACPPFADKDDMAVNINSTLQMPSDTPVLTVVDPKNAAAAAVRILGLTDKGAKQKVVDRIKAIKESFK
ncbi:AIR carboxylase family protein [Candidatus Peregrinibacteria bacterium]|jgi:5-(carboxyamino)imidazole ribonucleotide mutase|nr:AIR carboxylase family protein [Candidatus Peregrinibacteria bacterium]MBT4056399.1 AIR carboxylase family protein [Candidatus Peregrinibacteria bacterium]